MPSHKRRSVKRRCPKGSRRVGKVCKKSGRKSSRRKSSRRKSSKRKSSRRKSSKRKSSKRKSSRRKSSRRKSSRKREYLGKYPNGIYLLKAKLKYRPKNRANWEPVHGVSKKQGSTFDGDWWWADPSKEKIKKVKDKFRKLNPKPNPPPVFKIVKLPGIPSGYE